MFTKCPECGTEITNKTNHCPKCGYPITLSDAEKLSSDKTDMLEIMEKSKKESQILRKINILNNLKAKLITVSIICFCISAFFFCKGFYVKDIYENTGYSILNKNAYVEGDAYNFIINGTYFTGYSVVASSFLLGGIILFSGTVNVTLKIKELKWEI